MTIEEAYKRITKVEDNLRKIAEITVIVSRLVNDSISDKDRPRERVIT